jgi:hypothetical protein
MSEAKPYCISKWEVWEAYKRVKANQGAAGVDEQSIADFERDLVMCRNLFPRHCHELLPQISQNLARYAHLFTRATLAEMG